MADKEFNKSLLQELVTNIQGFSIHDGPGIRTVVFFKGCSLSCRWCANPECISGKVQTGFIKTLCRNCGKCLEVCPENAIRDTNDGHRIDYTKCTSCGICVKNCPHGALVTYGRPMTAANVFDAVRKDKIFYNSSGGGVTASGGEPLLRADFIRELFGMCRDDGIDTCIETCGFAGRDALIKVIPVTDHFLFDLKHMDADIHKRYTGHDNDLILSNARFIAEQGADIVFRQPLIPGVNDTAENIQATSDFIKDLGRKDIRLELMPYHKMGSGKYYALNMEYPMGDLAAAETEEVEKVRKAYEDRGTDCKISR